MVLVVFAETDIILLTVDALSVPKELLSTIHSILAETNVTKMNSLMEVFVFVVQALNSTPFIINVYQIVHKI